MLNIGRRVSYGYREHPKDTSEGFTWPSVTMGVAQLPVAHANTKGNPEGVKWPSVTSGSQLYYCTTTKKRKKTRGKKADHAQNILPARTASGQGHFRSRDFVTCGQKAPLGRIWRNSRLRMRITYFRTGHVTDVTSGHAQWSDPRKYGLSCTHILLMQVREVRVWLTAAI